jgi:hypothetical protein
MSTPSASAAPAVTPVVAVRTVTSQVNPSFTQTLPFAPLTVGDLVTVPHPTGGVVGWTVVGPNPVFRFLGTELAYVGRSKPRRLEYILGHQDESMGMGFPRENFRHATLEESAQFLEAERFKVDAERIRLGKV